MNPRYLRRNNVSMTVTSSLPSSSHHHHHHYYLLNRLGYMMLLFGSTFNRLKVPTVHDKVYNDECVLTFDSPFSDNGLYVNIITWQGFGEDVLQYDISKGGRVYLHQK